MLIDSHGRIHDYLRISLTEKCNLRCTYCMPEEGIKLRNKSHFMTADEVVTFAKLFVSLGVKKIRITGGEPLVNKEIRFILTELSKLPVELSITTNAVLLHDYFDLLQELNISKLNISIDSLGAASFNRISRRNHFDVVMKNIRTAIDLDFEVKLNVVVIKGVNEHEVIDFVKWSEQDNVAVRFIEFMPFDGNKWDWSKVVSQQLMLDEVKSSYPQNAISKLPDTEHIIARNYQVAGAKGTFGFISTITNSFCGTCNRIRLTADGKIKNCLFSADETDLLSVLRSGGDLESQIRISITNKHPQNAGIDFSDKKTLLDQRPMTAIGG
jgi:cyclic pyranopterin phosphate synthase